MCIYLTKIQPHSAINNDRVPNSAILVIRLIASVHPTADSLVIRLIYDLDFWHCRRSKIKVVLIKSIDELRLKVITSRLFGFGLSSAAKAP